MSPIQANYVHVLRRNNEEVDIMENQAIGMALGHMNTQGRALFPAPP